MFLMTHSKTASREETGAGGRKLLCKRKTMREDGNMPTVRENLRMRKFRSSDSEGENLGWS